MADYISQYTGTEIESAISSVLNPTYNDSNPMFAMGSSPNDSNHIFKKSGVKFLNAGDIECQTIWSQQLVTNTELKLKQPDTSTPIEGGQINFYTCDDVYTGAIDLHQSTATGNWNIRIFRPGYEVALFDLARGTLTVNNNWRSRSWIFTREATFTSPYSHTAPGAIGHFSCKTPSGAWALCTYDNNRLYFCYGPDTQYNAGSNSNYRLIQFGDDGKIYGASFGDYAETRKTNVNKPGTCVTEIGDGSLKETTKRLQRGCHIISDTYGMIIGPEQKDYQAIAFTGRVLAYIYEGREEASKHIGWPVCSGPNGTVSIMTEEEEQKYPSRIIGTISEIPTYETWGDGDTEVKGRIWIHVR